MAAAAAAAVQVQMLQAIEQQGAAIALLLAAPAAAAAAAAAAGPPQQAPSRLNVKLPTPANFAGAGSKLDTWAATIVVHLEFHGASMPPDQQVRFAVVYLEGAAQAWWQSVPAAARPATWDLLLADLRTQFQPVDSALDARIKLSKLHQNRTSVQDYAVEFRQLQIALPNESVETRVYGFIQGLRSDLAQKIWSQKDQPLTLNEAIQMASRLDSRAAIHQGSSSGSHRGAADLNNVEDYYADQSPADRLAYLEEQIAALTAAAPRQHTSRRDRGYGKPRYSPSSGVTPEQISERRRLNQCFSCGSSQHIKRDCPKNGSGDARSSNSKFSTSQNQGNW
jgi:hypothetical protein